MLNVLREYLIGLDKLSNINGDLPYLDEQATTLFITIHNLIETEKERVTNLLHEEETKIISKEE